MQVQVIPIHHAERSLRTKKGGNGWGGGEGLGAQRARNSKEDSHSRCPLPL